MADVLLTRQSVIFAKTESTYGDDVINSATPTPTDAILTTLPEFSFDVETYERNLARKSLSPLSPRVTNVNCAISFSCEIKGSGTATTPPEIDALLQACGFTKNVESAAVFYKPDTTASKSCTIYMFQGDPGQLKKITGCVGNVSFSVEQGGIGLANFEFQGQFDGTAAFGSGANAVSIPPANYQEELPPIAQNISFAYGSDTAFDCTNFELNMNNEIQNVKSMQSTDLTATNFFLSGRAPSGSFNPLLEAAMTTEDVIANLASSAARHIMFNLGTDTGNIVIFRLGASQSSGTVADNNAVTLTNIGFEDSDGLARYNCEYMLGATFDTGNDEVLIEFK